MCSTAKGSADKDVTTPIIPLKEVKRFMSDCMMSVGVQEMQAGELADVLAEADYRGHFSHGMNRLEIYVKDIKEGSCDPKGVPKIIKETAATAWVDGCDALGAVVGNYCMKVAIKKCKEVGVGLVVAKMSNHYGIAGIYPMLAMKEGLLGFSCTNTSPLASPTRSKGVALGTNPIALGAPAKDGDSFLLDMATTAVAVGKIEIARRKNESIPSGWLQDSDGKPITDPHKPGHLMPLGGSESNSGYKGFGLGMLVEVLCGILGGAQFGPNIRKWGDSHRPADLGQCFLAIDPGCFAPGFEDRMQTLIDFIRAMEPAEPGKPVLVPGDPERLHMKSADEAGGVRYVPNQMETCERLAKELNVKPLRAGSCC